MMYIEKIDFYNHYDTSTRVCMKLLALSLSIVITGCVSQVEKPNFQKVSHSTLPLICTITNKTEQTLLIEVLQPKSVAGTVALYPRRDRLNSQTFLCGSQIAVHAQVSAKPLATFTLNHDVQIHTKLPLRIS